MKTLKFTEHLVPSILSGEKDSTWRINDDKDLQVGDKLTFINKQTGESFGTAEILSIREMNLGEVNDSDFDDGHKKFESLEKMYEAYRGYYGDSVGPESKLKIIKFKFSPQE